MKWLMLGDEKIWYDDIADNVGLYKGK